MDAPATFQMHEETSRQTYDLYLSPWLPFVSGRSGKQTTCRKLIPAAKRCRTRIADFRAKAVVLLALGVRPAIGSMGEPEYRYGKGYRNDHPYKC
jgi:hypothetical protein